MLIERFANTLGPPAVLLAAIQATDTSCAVSNPSFFPALTGNDFFRMSIQDAVTGLIEIVFVTAAAGSTFTIQRGEENSVSAAHPANSQCINSATSGGAQAVANTGSEIAAAGALQMGSYDFSYFVNSAAAPGTIALPQNPIPLREYSIIDVAGNFGSFNQTITGANGFSYVMGLNGETAAGLTKKFIWRPAAGAWSVMQ